MFRVALLLLIAGALTVFVVQNALPTLPLVFLGMRTVAIPLGIWVVGAIAAGAMTTVLFSILFGVSGSAAASRARRSTGGRSKAQQVAGGDPPWNPPSWAAGQSSSVPPRDSNRAAQSATSRNASVNDDWDSSASAREAWNDWGTPAASTGVSYRPPVQDASYTYYPPPPESPLEKDYATGAEYNAPPDYEESAYQERDEWDDWEEEEVTDRGRAERSQPEEPPPPPRKIVEVKREPANRSQSGSVYSYTYRPADETPPPPRQPDPPRKESIYDAEFRVIMPPNQPPEAAPPAVEPAEPDAWDDWDDDDPRQSSEGTGGESFKRPPSDERSP